MTQQPSTAASSSQPKQRTIHLAKPLGQAGVTALICGIVGTLLGVMVDFLNIFQSLTESLQHIYASKPFYLTDLNGHHVIWDWIIALALATGIAYAVLDSRGKWRRIVILLMILSLLVMLSPLLMLWNVFWVPTSVCIAVLWSWICAFTYSCMHVMPCELGLPIEARKKKRAHQRLLRLKEMIKLRRKKHTLHTTPMHKSETVAELEKDIEEEIVQDLEQELAESESEVKAEFETLETAVKTQIKRDV